MRFIALLAAGWVCVSAGAATFTVDPAQSAVALSGAIITPFGTATLEEQGPGSLSTRLEGALEIDASAGQVTIPSGMIDARTNGVWQPAVGGNPGSAMADFGARGSVQFLGTVLGALREVVLNVNSPSRPLQGNQFDAAAITFGFPESSASSLDYSAGFAGTGREVLAGAATNRTATVGTITGAAGSRIVTITVDATFIFSLLSDNDTSLRVQGQILAREGGVAPPGAHFSDIEVVNNQVRLTVDGTAAAARLQSSINLTSWADKQAEVTVVDADTRVFTVPVGGPREFYQVVQ